MWLSHLTGTTGALSGLVLGVLDMAFLRLLGVRFYLGDGATEVSLAIGAFFTCSFVALGALVGQANQKRLKERAQASVIERQLTELSEQQARLAEHEKLASLGQLAGAIAHEVRNPLAIIRSTVQNIDEALATDDDLGHQSCTFAIEEIDRLTKVCDALVGFIRPLSLQRRSTPAALILSRTAQLAERLFKDGRVKLQAATQATADRPLWVDEDLVCQVLLGLLSNAASVSPKGARVELSGASKDAGFEFSVVDRGPGVPEELRERIFEPFFTTREEGAGLGLAVARQIISAHGGSIGVDEAPDGGARFTIRLDYAEVRP